MCQNAQLSKLAQNLKDESASFKVSEQDLLAEVKRFVKGMTREEMQRYDLIYRKWQDKGAPNISEQRQIQL